MIAADTKLVPRVMRSSRNGRGATAFVSDVASRLRNLRAIHTTLRTSAAMAAGASTHLMDVADVVNLRIESESGKVA